MREKAQSAATVRRPAADRGSATADVELDVGGLYRVISIIVASAHAALWHRPMRVAAGTSAISVAASDDGCDAVPSRRSTVYRSIVVATKTTPSRVQTDPDRGRTNCSGPCSNDWSSRGTRRTTANSRATSNTCVKSITSYLSGVMTSGPRAKLAFCNTQCSEKSPAMSDNRHCSFNSPVPCNRSSVSSSKVYFCFCQDLTNKAKAAELLGRRRGPTGDEAALSVSYQSI